MIEPPRLPEDDAFRFVVILLVAAALGLLALWIF